MTLEHFTLGLREERYFPPEPGEVEGWLGILGSNKMVTVFSADYNNVAGEDHPGRWKFLITVRTVPPVHADSRHEWFGHYSKGNNFFRQWVNSLDALTLKCILMDQGYLVPPEVT